MLTTANSHLTHPSEAQQLGSCISRLGFPSGGAVSGLLVLLDLESQVIHPPGQGVRAAAGVATSLSLSGLCSGLHSCLF